jgi:hypothetical protein
MISVHRNSLFFMTLVYLWSLLTFGHIRQGPQVLVSEEVGLNPSLVIEYICVCVCFSLDHPD